MALNALRDFGKSKKKDQIDINVLEHQGIIHIDSLLKANFLNNRFASVFTQEDLSQIP